MILLLACAHRVPDPSLEDDRASLEGTAIELAPGLSGCLTRAKERDATVVGEVVLKVAVGNGEVIYAEPLSNSTGDALLAACLQDGVKGWAFEPGVSGSLELPFQVK